MSGTIQLRPVLKSEKQFSDNKSEEDVSITQTGVQPFGFGHGIDGDSEERSHMRSKFGISDRAERTVTRSSSRLSCVRSCSHTCALIQMARTPALSAGRMSERMLFPTIHADPTSRSSASTTARMISGDFSGTISTI